MSKQQGAFLTIGELAAELSVPQHILRYWETRFPSLRPLQRAGNRRYYRVEDVELARRIHRLLYIEGYTVRGAQQALEGHAPRGGTADADSAGRPKPGETAKLDAPVPLGQNRNGADPQGAMREGLEANDEFIARLVAIRDTLSSVLS